VKRYRAYGLVIASDLHLPELLPGGDGAADVVIRLGAVDHRPPPRRTDGAAYAVSPDEVCFFWEQVGAFQVRNGSEIVVESLPGAEEQLIRLPLLGSVIGVLLHQRGLLPLHASAVAIDGNVAVFLGCKGEGKSTIAAALYRRGHAVLSDDIVGIKVETAAPALAHPGFPQLKLFDDAVVGSLGTDPKTLPRLATIIDKRAQRVDARFPADPLPVAAIFALDDGPNIELSRFGIADAMTTLVGSSIPGRFGRDLLDGAGAVAHFRRCTDLLRATRAYRLARPRALADLDAVARAVESRMRVPVDVGS